MPSSSSTAGFSSRGWISWISNAVVATKAPSRSGSEGRGSLAPGPSESVRSCRPALAADEHDVARGRQVADAGLVHGDEEPQAGSSARQRGELEALCLWRAEAHTLDDHPLPERRAALDVEGAVLERPGGVDTGDEPGADALERQLRRDRGLDFGALQIAPLRLVRGEERG